MDWDRIAGNWKQLSGRIKEKWGKLTDDDLTAESMAGAISSRARSKSGTAMRRIRSVKMSMIGSTPSERFSEGF
jgi:uncharacterized protein YjbJ (UPF0337 family)